MIARLWKTKYETDLAQTQDTTIAIRSTGEIHRTLKGHTAYVSGVSFSPDSQVLAGGSDDKVIHLWDVKSGRFLFTLSGHTDSVYSVMFSPKGESIASGNRDGTVLLWDVTITE